MEYNDFSDWMDHINEIEDTGIMYVSDEDYDWIMDQLADCDCEYLDLNLDDPMFSRDCCDKE